MGVPPKSQGSSKSVKSFGSGRKSREVKGLNSFKKQRLTERVSALFRPFRELTLIVVPVWSPLAPHGANVYLRVCLYLPLKISVADPVLQRGGIPAGTRRGGASARGGTGRGCRVLKANYKLDPVGAVETSHV